MKKIEKNKIEVVVKYFFPVTAGIETNIFETYTRLIEKGWDVNINTSKDTYLEKGKLSEKDVFGKLNVRRYDFGIFGFFPKLNYDETAIIALHNFDIFPHFQILFIAFIFKVLNKKKFKLVLTPHGGFNPCWQTFPFFKRLLKKIYHKTLGVFLVNFVVDQIRAVSEWERKEMIAQGLYPKKIMVIPNGIENEAFEDVGKKASTEIKNRVKKYGKYLVQIGRIYEIKNYETVIKAITLLPRDINYVIAGPVQDSDKYLKFLKKMVKELNLEERVFFAGVVRKYDKYYLINNAQMMVHMAMWESYCNVVHEGMSQGLVCLVARNTALPYLVKDGISGFCLETRDSKALGEKIKFVLDKKNSAFIKNIEKGNRKLSLEDSWDNTAEKVNKLYAKELSISN